MIRRVLFGLALAAVLAAPAQAATLPGRLAAALTASSARTGAIAVDLSTGKVLFQQSASAPFVPASNEKLTVTYAALGLLGPSFRIRTEVLGSGQQAGAVFHGNVVLRGYGDPTLSHWGLRALARRVRAAGITQVTGAVVGDESYFDSARTAPGWKPSFYIEESPPLSALIVDRGVYDGHVARNPPLAAAGAFKQALRAAGVSVAGPARAGRGEGQPITNILSPPLATILRAMDADSDNFTAELILKELGAIGEARGTTAAGARVVRAMLGANHVPLAGVRIVDGSGLSELDRVTPRALAAILVNVWADPALRAVLTSALAVAGVRGTLEHRMTTPPFRGNVLGKTGTTNLSSALSGYVSGRYAFSVIENGNPVPTWSARTAQDRFVEALAGA